MQTKQSLFLGACLLLTPAVEAQTDYVLVLPEAGVSDPQSVMELLDDTLINTVSRGDGFTLIRADDGNVIATFQVPDQARGSNASWRQREFRSDYMAMGGYFDALETGARDPAADFANVPGIFDAIARNRADTGRDMRVLFVGSPIYQNAVSPSFSMMGQDGTMSVPNTAHFSSPTSRTPYGRSSSESGLAGTYVHFCAIDDGQLADFELQAAGATWSAFIEARGGSMVTWSADLQPCIQRFQAGVSDRSDLPQPPDGAELEMVQISQDGVPIDQRISEDLIVRDQQLDALAEELEVARNELDRRDRQILRIEEDWQRRMSEIAEREQDSSIEEARLAVERQHLEDRAEEMEREFRQARELAASRAREIDQLEATVGTLRAMYPSMFDADGSIVPPEARNDLPSTISVFSHTLHPGRRTLTVSTGTDYNFDEWPQFNSSWCYFKATTSDNLLVQIDVGRLNRGRDVDWADPPHQALRATGLSESVFMAARASCQFPTD